MNIIIFIDKSTNDEEHIVKNAETFTKDELFRFFNSENHYKYYTKLNNNNDNLDKIPKISLDEELMPENFFNINDYGIIEPNYGYFIRVDEKFMKKLFKLWDKHNEYKNNEYIRILKKLYREYINEASIKDIIE